ncbi:MAG TPA: hypothetical protein VGC05_14100 [Mycobacterium sp.]
MDDDLVPTALLTRVLGRHLRLPASWDDPEREEFVAEAAQEVAYRVAELADDWAERAVTEWGRAHWQLPDADTHARVVQQARTAALVAVLCEVLPEVAVDEFFSAA